MQKSLKIVSIVLFSLIFCLALFFAFNSKSEIKAFAESAPSIQIDGSDYADLQSAIEAVPANTPTEIHISGEIVLSETITIQGTSGQVKKIKFVAVDNTTIIRSSTNTEFIMFNIGEHSEISFETETGKELIIDGNRKGIAPKFGMAYSIFDLTNSFLLLNGEIVIQNNSAENAAVVKMISGSSTLKCNGTKFIDNASHNVGGAIWTRGGVVELVNCVFDSNYAGGNGGAICSFSSQVDIENCFFKENMLNGKTYDGGTYLFYGGSLYVEGGITTITKNCFFENSKTKNYQDSSTILGAGGAIALRSGALNINGATISGCEADFGGAIAVLGGKLTVNNFTVSGNTAAQAGGGLYLKAGNVEILNGTIENNETTRIGKAEDVEWLISDSGSTYLENNIFSANVASKNKYAINSESIFPVGENFALGEGSYLQLLVDKYVQVLEKLKTTNKIILNASSSTGNAVGMRVVYFANEDVITQGVFEMATPEWNLVLGKDNTTGVNYLSISTEYRVQFYQYYDPVNGNTNPLTAEGQEFTQRVEYNNEAEVPNPGTRDGMIFVGWEARLWLTPDKTDPNITPKHITANVVFCGVWGVKIEVTFLADGDQIGKPIEMASNTAIPQEKLDDYEIPDKTGYTDTDPYWGILVDGKLEEYTNQAISESCSLFAVYIPNIMNVTLKSEKGIELLTVEVNYNETLTADAINTFPALDLTRFGYDQVAPYWAYAGTTTQFNPSTPITQHTILVATYVKNKYTVSFQVEYHKAAGVDQTDTNFAPKIYEFEDTVSEFPTAAAKEGYDQTKVVWDYDGKKITSDLTITGRIDINKYKVSFIAGEEILATYEKEHFARLTAAEIPKIPTLEGHTQRAPSWNEDTAAEIKSNTNFQAIYYLNVYYVTFILPDNTKIEPREVKHGHTVDNSNIIDIGFGEIVKYDKPLENITESCEIKVTKINLFMWIMIGVGVIVLAISGFMIYKLVKRRQVIAAARKRHRHIGPYVTGDDEYD